MNERILELAKKAGLKVNADGEISPYQLFYGSVDAGYKQFALLIVKECLSVVDQPNGVSDDDVIKISDDIKKHFGVEE